MKLYQFVIPIFLPGRDSEQDKVECPKCHHRFIPSDGDAPWWAITLCLLAFLFIGVPVLVFVLEKGLFPILDWITK